MVVAVVHVCVCLCCAGRLIIPLLNVSRVQIALYTCIDFLGKVCDGFGNFPYSLKILNELGV